MESKKMFNCYPNILSQLFCGTPTYGNYGNYGSIANMGSVYNYSGCCSMNGAMIGSLVTQSIFGIIGMGMRMGAASSASRTQSHSETQDTTQKTQTKINDLNTKIKKNLDTLEIDETEVDNTTNNKITKADKIDAQKKIVNAWTELKTQNITIGKREYTYAFILDYESSIKDQINSDYSGDSDDVKNAKADALFALTQEKYKAKQAKDAADAAEKEIVALEDEAAENKELLKATQKLIKERDELQKGLNEAAAKTKKEEEDKTLDELDGNGCCHKTKEAKLAKKVETATTNTEFTEKELQTALYQYTQAKNEQDEARAAETFVKIYNNCDSQTKKKFETAFNRITHDYTNLGKNTKFDAPKPVAAEEVVEEVETSTKTETTVKSSTYNYNNVLFDKLINHESSLSNDDNAKLETDLGINVAKKTFSSKTLQILDSDQINTLKEKGYEFNV